MLGCRLIVAVCIVASLVFLTDCGTSYQQTCIPRMIYALRSRPDLIGVTARQRVERPNAEFRPCENTKMTFLRGKHPESGHCWRCSVAFYCSPAPLQGYEFEATLILNSALFNIVEAMPVLPGPCQLLDWPKMKTNRVVEEYFDLLFNEETANKPAPGQKKPLPSGYFKSRAEIGKPLLCDDSFNADRAEAGLQIPSIASSVTDMSDVSELTDDTFNDEGFVVKIATTEEKAALRAKEVAISMTEFLRVNMRLAEDRVLSFVTVFCTGYGTVSQSVIRQAGSQC